MGYSLRTAAQTPLIINPNERLWVDATRLGNHMTSQGQTDNVGDSSSGNLWHTLARWVTEGDVGSLPVLLGHVLIAVIFQIANPNFLSPLNLTNLMVQISAVGTISVGVVLFLLIGEIDLSIGAVSGLSAGVMFVLSVKVGMPAIIAIAAGVVTGVAIGLFQGWWVAKLHVPSFVVTLAGFLGWQGALLFVLGSTGTINLTDPLIVGLANTRLPVVFGWLFAALFVGGYAYSQWHGRQQRLRAQLEAPGLAGLIGQVVVVGAVVLLATAVMSIDRNPNPKVVIAGVPTAVLNFGHL